MPIFAKFIETLAPEAKKMAETMAPEVKAYLAYALPKLGERWVPAFNAAKKKFPTEEWGKIEAVAPQFASYLRASRTGMSPRKAYAEVFSETTQDLLGQSLPLRETSAAGKAGQIVDYVRPQLPSSTSPIKYQAQIKERQQKVTNALAAGKPEEAERQQEILGKLGEFVKGKKVIKEVPWFLGRFSVFSPKTTFDYSLGVQSSLVNDFAAAVTAGDSNVKMLRNWWRSLVQANGGFKNMGMDKTFQKDMAKLWVDTYPLQERYYANATKMQNMVNAYKKATAGGDQTAAEKALTTVNKFKPTFTKSLQDLNQKRYPVFSKYFNEPDVRIALYREPETRSWVEKLMQPNEIKIAEGHEALMGKAREYAEQLGIPVLDREKDYVTHLIGKLSDIAGKSLDKTTLQKARDVIPKLMKFKERTPGSLQFFPSIGTATETYIAQSSRKFAISEFTSKWKNIIERDLQHWPRLQKMAEAYVKSNVSRMQDPNAWNKMLRGLTAWTYLTKTGLSPAVAAKHALKLAALFSMHPMEAFQALPPTIKAGAQLALQRFGVKPGAEARLMREFVANRNLYEQFSGLVGPEGKYASAIMNVVAATPTNFVEMFERGLGINMALAKMQKRGLSYKQFHQGVWQTIMDSAFMGKADNFLWLNKPWQQFMAIFAYTPGQITDRTFRYILKSFPERYITEMKAGVLETAYRLPRDAFGTPYLSHVVKGLTTAGALYGVAKHYDVSPSWMLQTAFAHIPMTRHTAIGTQPTLPIPYELWQTARKRGGETEDWASTLYDFFTSFPALDRMKGAWRDELNRMSGGSPFKHILGIPSESEEEKIIRKIEKGKGFGLSPAWERKQATKRREKTLLGPLYNEYMQPWLRR